MTKDILEQKMEMSLYQKHWLPETIIKYKQSHKSYFFINVYTFKLCLSILVGPAFTNGGELFVVIPLW